MRQKCIALLTTLMVMLAIGVLRDTGAVGRASAVAKADPFCVYVGPIPPNWGGGYVCTP